MDLTFVITSLILHSLELGLTTITILVSRALRVFRLTRIALRATKTVKNAPRSIRQVIRMNKQGYVDEKYDLDLCYITSNVIAMSVPATGIEAIWRNSILGVRDFLRDKHGTRYMIFDLCLERTYDAAFFDGRVTHFKFHDHGVPTITNMFSLCQSVAEWMDRHEENIVAIHCKGGKGRTGTMICAWLLYRYADATPNDAIKLFAEMRTNQLKSQVSQGIETSSQKRYVGYFYKFLRHPEFLSFRRALNLTKIVIGPLHERDTDLRRVRWVVRLVERDESDIANERLYAFADGRVLQNESYSQETNTNCIVFESDDNEEQEPRPLRLSGNIQILIVKHYDTKGSKNASGNSSFNPSNASTFDLVENSSEFVSEINESKEMSFSDKDIEQFEKDSKGKAKHRKTKSRINIGRADLASLLSPGGSNNKTKSGKKNGPEMFVSCWIHTYFMRRKELPISLKKVELDVLQKDVNHKRAPEEFELRIHGFCT